MRKMSNCNPPQKPQLLENWLQNPTPPPPPPPSSSPKEILQAWSTLRTCLQSKTLDPSTLLPPLLTLSTSLPSLHLSDPHASLLLSLLRLPLLPPHSLPPILRLLSAWARSSRSPSPSLLSSAFASLHPLLKPPLDPPIAAHSILLLAAISASPHPPPSSLDLLSSLLNDPHLLRSCRDFAPELLSSIGHALLRADGSHFPRILASSMSIWRHGPSPCIPHGLMLLKLFDWLVSGLLRSCTFDRIASLCREISLFREKNFVEFSVIMAASGVLRAFNRLAPNGAVEFNRVDARKLVEDSIDSIAADLNSKLQDDFSTSLDARGSRNRLLLQCLSLGMAQSGLVSFRSSVLLCLTHALLNEIFPLNSFYQRITENPNENPAELEIDEVKAHLDGVLFKEAGAVTAAFCDQYNVASEEDKLVAENHVWGYCLESYSTHRLAALLLWVSRKELLVELEKIAEAGFLMVVVFASAVSKHKVSSKFPSEIQSEAAVSILVAFSCMEYLRRVRLPEYSDTIRRVVLCVQESDAACVSFIDSMPPYLDLTNHQGLRRSRYVWYEDEVQTARVLFYLRVILACVDRIFHDDFSRTVASTMFLFMQHPSGKVARASHSVFAAFLSSGRIIQDDQALLKEQLAFYYMQRALEAYPGITPFEGLASGVVALVRNLPAGSPATFYCIDKIIEKATLLCSGEVAKEKSMWKNWQGNSGPSKKILELLLRLMTLVDIQVFPFLLKNLAQLIASGLPKEGQDVVLDEVYSLISDSDDVTRKPILVSWVQSLSFLCSQALDTGGKHQSINSISIEGRHLSSYTDNMLGLDTINSRL